MKKTKACPKCKCEIDKKATVCPYCQSKIGMSLSGCLGAFVTVIVVIIAFAVIIPGCNSGYDKAQNNQSESERVITNESAVKSEEKTEPKETIGQKNARQKALDYLDVMPFSYTGLIEQLKFDGYSVEEATYGADHCGANWNEQAAKKAQSYLDVMSFSKSGLIEQLKFDGFTQEQAEYGVTAVGY